VSDLQCAATIVLARHGDAEYDADAWPDAGGSLTALGRSQARTLAESLQDRRIATIWCSDLARAVQTAEIAAGVLGVGVRVRSQLREFTVGRSDETPDELYARVSGELQALADSCRGETALVISHGGAIEHTVPRLASNVSSQFAPAAPLGNCATCELTADADGWVLTAWQGTAVSAAAP
jgi:2,3-bisphosphoglycerate-dependent phosphoglycerate mutase